MVIEEIDVANVAILKAASDPPIPTDSHGPEALQVALERVQAKTRKVERLRRFSGVERRENTLNFAPQRRVDSARIVAFVEPLEATMPKAPDHNRLYSDNCR